MHVIVCGGGVIGACTAFFLASRGARVTVVERSGVANAASGKSGGFLALDWCRGSAMDEMARHSFALHDELASTVAPRHGLDWGYRRLDTLGVVASQRQSVSHLARRPAPDWIAPGAAVHDRIGTPETTAALDPARFTTGMMTAAEAEGAVVRAGTVDGVVFEDGGRQVTGVLVEGEPLDGDAVVIAMGPWSILASRWLPLPGVFGLKGHSLVFRYDPGPAAAALFVEIETPEGEIETPEVIPRADGTTYVCGLSSQALLPLDPAAVASDEGAIDTLRELAALVSPALGAAPVIASQACHRPVTEDGLPVIGAVAGVAGAFVASGHGVWGMLNGPATGQAMAQLILDDAPAEIDLTPFDPARLARFDPDRLDTR